MRLELGALLPLESAKLAGVGALEILAQIALEIAQLPLMCLGQISQLACMRLLEGAQLTRIALLERTHGADVRAPLVRRSRGRFGRLRLHLGHTRLGGGSTRLRLSRPRRRCRCTRARRRPMSLGFCSSLGSSLSFCDSLGGSLCGRLCFRAGRSRDEQLALGHRSGTIRPVPIGPGGDPRGGLALLLVRELFGTDVVTDFVLGELFGRRLHFSLLAQEHRRRRRRRRRRRTRLR